MSSVRPKKFLGQHFLTDQHIAGKITEALSGCSGVKNVLEIGPGTGILTQYLVKIPGIKLRMIDIDAESVDYLMKQFPERGKDIIRGDFLKMPFNSYFGEPFCIIGNFPYNISTQILFRLFENRPWVPVLVGMFQHEVAKRICSPPGNKDYGILSVLLQAFYRTEYLFTVDEHVFNPPPKVKSGVIRLIRKENFILGADESLFIKTVKAGFNQRRKTLRNALKPLVRELPADLPVLSQRAEELSYEEFAGLVNILFPGNEGV